jgi:two-component system invasion response regulator UvrY
MKFLIADDWAIFRSGIRQILFEEFGPLEVTQGAPAPDALDLASGPWDLAVVTVDVPTREGLRFLAVLRRAYPHQRVLAVALRENIAYVESALKSSIRGSIAKESTPEELVTAVRRAIAGRKGADPAVRAGRTVKRVLSKRELQVLRLVAAGKSIKEVAAALDVRANTVSTYRVRMLRKLNLNTTAELIRYALMTRLAE